MKNHVRFRCLGTAVLIVATSAASALSADMPLTLNQAIDIAERRNTSIMAACATYASARGELSDTRALLWNNPEIAIEHRRRELFQAEIGRAHV